MPKLSDFNDNINQTTIDNDMEIIRTGSTINGWNVGASVAATGPGNVAITNKYNNARQINLGTGKSVDLKNAVRLLVNDGQNYGNIWHAFTARSGHKYIFTWYDLADYITGDTQKYNEKYHVHISENNPVHNPAYLKKDIYTSDWGVWRKKSIEYTHSDADKTLYISFECRNDDNRYRGALVTLINGYLDSEDDSDDTDVSNFRLIGPAPAELVLKKSQASDKQVQNTSRWEFSLQQTQSNGVTWGDPEKDENVRFTFKGDVTAGGNNQSYWGHTQQKGDENFYVGQNALHATAPTSDTQSDMTASLVVAGDVHKMLHVGYMNNASFTPYYPTDPTNGRIPLILKGAAAADSWTINGQIPSPLSAETKVTFTLLKNGNAPGSTEKVSIGLDTAAYLTVAPDTSVTTDTDGKFTLTLTPKSGQSESHTTSLTLKHGENTVATYPIKTGEALTAKYDIKVYKDPDGKQPINLNAINTWTADTGHYVYVSVVKHDTSDRVDTASINIAVSPTTALVPVTSPVKIVNGTPARVAFKPGTSGNATITFSTTIDGQKCLAELRVYLGESGSLEVVTSTPITLSPGIERTPSGDQAVLDVRFNPKVSGAVPDISFRVDGDDLTVLSEENIFVTDGVLKPADPKGNGDYRILPVLKTDKNASEPAKITFFIDDVKYPQDAAKWKQVTVPVNISSVDHVNWSVVSGQSVDTGTNPTVLKTGLKAFDASGKEMSSYVLDVHIVAVDVDVTFVDNTLSHTLTGPDNTGWAHLPEMSVGQKSGIFHLQASQPGSGGYLKDELPLTVTVAERPKDIVIHPDGAYAISWDDLDSGKFTHDSSRYAQLNDAAGHAVHSGKVTFTIDPGTANAKMAPPYDASTTQTVKTVAVNANGRAVWPDIIIGKTTGSFTLTASNPDVSAAQTVKITVS